jgi:hypothetical protein
LNAIGDRGAHSARSLAGALLRWSYFLARAAASMGALKLMRS